MVVLIFLFFIYFSVVYFCTNSVCFSQGCGGSCGQKPLGQLEYSVPLDLLKVGEMGILENWIFKIDMLCQREGGTETLSLL